MPGQIAAPVRPPLNRREAGIVAIRPAGGPCTRSWGLAEARRRLEAIPPHSCAALDNPYTTCRPGWTRPAVAKGPSHTSRPSHGCRPRQLRGGRSPGQRADLGLQRCPPRRVQACRGRPGLQVRGSSAAGLPTHPSHDRRSGWNAFSTYGQRTAIEELMPGGLPRHSHPFCTVAQTPPGVSGMLSPVVASRGRGGSLGLQAQAGQAPRCHPSQASHGGHTDETD